MTAEAKQRPNDNEIDFTAIFSIIWRHRKLIVFGTVAATLLTAAISFFIPKTYRSEGFYQLGNPEKKIEIVNDNDKEKEKEKENIIGIPIPLYKKSAPQFFNPNRFYQFASEWELFNEKDLNKVKTKFPDHC